MSGGKDDGFANRTLDNYLGGVTLARPSNLYFQATSTIPTAATPGTPLLSRVAIPNDSVHFPAASSQTKTNGLAVDLGSTAGMLGLSHIVGFELYDAASGGLRSYFGTVTSTDLSDAADSAFAPGALTITEA